MTEEIENTLATKIEYESLPSGSELIVDDIVEIWHLVNYHIENVRVIEVLDGGVYKVRGIKTGNIGHLRLAKRKVARENGVYDIVVQKRGSKRWVLKEGSGEAFMWGHWARRIKPTNEET